MKTLALLLLLCLSGISGFAQIYRVSFSGDGDAKRIDWVRATNVNTHETVTIKGNETLYIQVVWPHFTDVAAIPAEEETGLIFPNPFRGNTTLYVNVSNPQQVSVSVRNLSGQEIARTTEYVQAGGNEFSISIPAAGMFFITTTTAQGTTGRKVICTDPEGSDCAIVLKGNSGSANQEYYSSALKSDRIREPLMIRKGDVIMYEIISGQMTTVMTEAPDGSKNHKVIFAKCSDPAGNNYRTITIGKQTWMAENLAWLPAVHTTDDGSLVKPKYYVYGYQGLDTRKAKAQTNYNLYGVLYNWRAARLACPEGWRLPSDYDWAILEKYLGMNESEAAQPGWRHSGGVGCLLKEPGDSHWRIGAPALEKLSGFTALPGGYAPVAAAEVDRGKSGYEPEDAGVIGFERLGRCSFFWTATQNNPQYAWARRLGCSENGVEKTTGIKSFGFSVRCIRDVAIENAFDGRDE